MNALALNHPLNHHKRQLTCLLFGMCAFFWLPTSQALDPLKSIDVAIEKIQEGEHSLARSYLDPAIISPRLNPGHRSKAFYMRGYSYFIQRQYVSARKDYHRALEFNPENPAAQAALGRLYYYGQGVKKQPELAITLFEQAVEKEHPAAQFHLGHAYLTGTGVEADLETARSWLEKSAAQDYGPALSHLALSYRPPHTPTPDAELARQWYEKAIALGDSDSKVALAYMYAQGDFGEKDLKQSISLLNEASDSGSANAKIALSHYLIGGIGMREDPKRAVTLLESAAELGVPDAHFRLGYLHQVGLGLPQDEGKALAAYERAGMLGHIEAQLRAAMMLLTSDDTTKQVAGQKWLERSAQSDNPQTHNDFAWILATSKNAALRDGARALEYAQKAVAVERRPAYLDTLAAAYAELGQFEEAVSTQRAAIEALTSGTSGISGGSSKAANSGEKTGESGATADSGTPDPALLKELESHLAAYSAEKAWRE